MRGGGIVINDLENKSDISFVLNENKVFDNYDEKPYLDFNTEEPIKKVMVKNHIYTPNKNRMKSKDPISTLTSTEIIDIGKFSPDGKTVTLDGTTYNVGNIKAEKEYLTETDEQDNILSTVYHITIKNR